VLLVTFLSPDTFTSKVLEAQGARFKPKLIIVILPENALDLYTAVKHFGDIRRGVTTQCVVRP